MVFACILGFFFLLWVSLLIRLLINSYYSLFSWVITLSLLRLGFRGWVYLVFVCCYFLVGVMVLDCLGGCSWCL